jgi:hypothetical protein
MTGEQLATLVNIGSAGAVIAVVMVFLRFIKERDADWRSFFTGIRESDSEGLEKLTLVIDKLVARMESLETKFDRHDATEMELLRGLIAKSERKTQPRKQ